MNSAYFVTTVNPVVVLMTVSCVRVDISTRCRGLCQKNPAPVIFRSGLMLDLWMNGRSGNCRGKKACR